MPQHGLSTELYNVMLVNVYLCNAVRFVYHIMRLRSFCWDFFYCVRYLRALFYLIDFCCAHALYGKVMQLFQCFFLDRCRSEDRSPLYLSQCKDG